MAASFMTSASQVSGLRATRGRPSMLTLLARWIELRRSRTALSELNADQLRDIGLSEETARKEASRPFWDAPSHWR
ncbi:MAG: DUF1127 domain-containing protein [Pseudomonadota bacterium]